MALRTSGKVEYDLQGHLAVRGSLVGRVGGGVPWAALPSGQ